MNGIIEIEGMEFFAFHGCYETERVVGNKFMVYARIETDRRCIKLSHRIRDYRQINDDYLTLVGTRGQKNDRRTL